MDAEIAVASPAEADDPALMGEVSALVNEVYAEAESGLWADGPGRTSPAEIEGFARDGEMALARSTGALVGCVRVHRVDDDVSELGLLAAAPTVRSTGLGRGLVGFAERWSLEQGRSTMQLELLIPRVGSHPSKVFLDQWYSRLGYRVVETAIFGEAYPELAPALARACDLVIYRKDLRSATDRPQASAGTS